MGEQGSKGEAGENGPRGDRGESGIVGAVGNKVVSLPKGRNFDNHLCALQN